MTALLDRVFEVHSTALMAFVPKDPWDRPRFKWRVSQDVWDGLNEWASSMYGWPRRPEPGWTDMLLGWPIDMDPALPPNSMVLE